MTTKGTKGEPSAKPSTRKQASVKGASERKGKSERKGISERKGVSERLGTASERAGTVADSKEMVSAFDAHITYPDHDHPPEEVYIALSPGDWWNAACDLFSFITLTGTITATRERNWANRSTKFAARPISRRRRW